MTSQRVHGKGFNLPYARTRENRVLDANVRVGPLIINHMSKGWASSSTQVMDQESMLLRVKGLDFHYREY